MSWKPEIDELRRREALAHEMGGAEKVERQHHFGKLTIRERIDAISDPSSFEEIGALAGVASYDENGELKAFTPSNFVLGTARLDGRPVVLSGDDFTVRGGSADASIAGKRDRAEGLALELRLPLAKAHLPVTRQPPSHRVALPWIPAPHASTASRGPNRRRATS